MCGGGGVGKQKKLSSKSRNVAEGGVGPHCAVTHIHTDTHTHTYTHGYIHTTHMYKKERKKFGNERRCILEVHI